jgi:ATP diphosphatase
MVHPARGHLIYSFAFTLPCLPTAGTDMQPSRDISRLLEIMVALRAPGTGCAWDLQQSFQTIVPYTIEEAYEIADAVERGDLEDLREELGDLLLQVVFQARIAEEKQAFDFGGVVEAITSKMIRRHPHVFGSARDLSPEAVKDLWAQIKASEKAKKMAAQGEAASNLDHGTVASLLADVPLAMPALTRAVKLQSKAAGVGFDWDDMKLVLAKIREELEEVEAALAANDSVETAKEIGDVLFAVVNLARHTHNDPEAALRSTNAKFGRRFHFIENELARQGRTLESATLGEMDALWEAAKRLEALPPIDENG